LTSIELWPHRAKKKCYKFLDDNFISSMFIWGLVNIMVPTIDFGERMWKQSYECAKTKPNEN
jgi:hypothetical protein